MLDGKCSGVYKRQDYSFAVMKLTVSRDENCILSSCEKVLH